MVDPSRRNVLLAGLALAGFARGARAAAVDPPEVSTRLGRLRGAMEEGTRVFRGIPYAEPPVGPLRFRAPRPPRPWTGVLDATRFGAPSLQFGGAAGDIPAPSEDCLRLNVWAPATPGPHPVLVFLHAGGNQFGHAALPVYDGARFARDGVVVVTLNYRVGALGWVELGPYLRGYEGSGNNTLRDMMAALAWVRAHIADFGGDPHRVTLGGALAGAKNLAALLAAPSAAGLFHRAILMSGSAHSIHLPEEADVVARLYIDGHTGRAEDLLTATPQQLLAAQAKVQGRYDPAQRKIIGGFNHGAPFRPIVDGRLIPRPPTAAFRAGASRNVPVIVGNVRDEGIQTLPPGARETPFPLDQNELNSRFDLGQLGDVDLRYQRAFPAMSPLDRRLRLMHGEEYWISGVRIAEARAQAGAKTWMYRSDRVMSSGLYPGYAPLGSDVPLVFDTLDKGEVVPIQATITDGDRALARTAHALWVSFIKTGVPAANGAPGWPPYSLPERRTLILGYQPHVEADPLAEERRLWDGYFA